jgi:glycosyltransferase involved in cell wall biosynthesis
MDGRYWKALRARCVRDSLAATFLNYMEHTIHRFMRIYEKIDLLLAPSNFLRDLHIRMGIDPRKIVTVENFKDLQTYEPQYEHKRYVLFFGRFSVEKGIKTLVDSMKDIPDIPLKIAGRGPDEDVLKEYAQTSNLKNVEFVGFKTGEDLAQLIKDSAIVVVPSEWYENCSNTVIEAFAYGKPVIGSEIGGIPEQVVHGRNGLLFPAGDSGKLAEAISLLYRDEERIRSMGIEARKTVETKYSGERHYERLIEIYRNLIARKGRA